MGKVTLFLNLGAIIARGMTLRSDNNGSVVFGEKFCEECFNCREAEYVILNKLADFVSIE